MKEQSHKAEMATALRGDFARLRARGVATTLPAPPVDVVAEPAPPRGEPRVVAAEPVVEPVAETPTGQPAASSWIDRLRRR